MKMKKILMALVGFIILSGCSEDVLNLDNPAQYDETNYFKTQKECQEVIAACYSDLTMRPFYGRDWYFMFDLLSGQASKTANLEVDLVQFDEFTYQPENQYIDMAWLGLYRMSLRALLAFDKISAWETTGEDEAAYKDQMIGEAYFFQAWAYYYLTQLWGDVPYHDTWESIKNEPTLPRTPYADIQPKIEEALTTAIEKLPESWSDNFLGRVTKDAARALLGKLYLTEGENDKAITAFESIKTTTYNDDYYALFNRGNHTSPEIIMQVLHKFYGWGEGNSYYMFGGKEDWGGKATNCARHLEYGFNDWNNASIPDAAANKFHYTINGHDYIDPRNQFIMYGDGVMGDNTFAGGAFPYRPQDGTTFSGYKWKKYCLYEEFENVAIEDGDYSSVLIRVADIKLLTAEAYIAKGDYEKAKALINEVRTRTAVKAEAYSALDASNAFEILKRERYIELFGEQQYWFDLVRWDRLGKLNMMDELKSGANSKYKKFPIPTQEKETNSNMKLPGVITDGWN